MSEASKRNDVVLMGVGKKRVEQFGLDGTDWFVDLTASSPSSMPVQPLDSSTYHRTKPES